MVLLLQARSLTRAIVPSSLCLAVIVLTPDIIISWAVALRYLLAAATGAAAAAGSCACGCLLLCVRAVVLQGLLQCVEGPWLDGDQLAKAWD
jgi:hypothetical protein